MVKLEEGECSNGDVTTVYFLNVHISCIWNYLPHVPSSMCILAKASEVTSGVWQRVMQSCGDKNSIYNEEKTKEEENTEKFLEQTWMEHYVLFCYILLFFVISSRLPHSVLTSDIITVHR